MKSKAEFLKEIVELFCSPKIKKWYDRNLYGCAQSDTLDTLEAAVQTHELTLHEALTICLVVGIQWQEKFPGVP